MLVHRYFSYPVILVPVYDVAIIDVNLCKIEMSHETITASGLWSSVLPGGHPKFYMGVYPLTDFSCSSDRAAAAKQQCQHKCLGLLHELLR